MIGSNEGLSNILSYSKNGLIVTSYENDYISQGVAFQIHRRIPIGASATVKVVFDYSALVDKGIFTLPIMAKTNCCQCYLNTYKIETYTGGSELPSINRNGVSSNIAECVVKIGVTSADIAGDDLREYIVGALSTRQNSGGGSISGESPKIFESGDIIMFEIINQENDAVDFELNFNWYEV